MEQLNSYADSRLIDGCVYCGKSPDTRDHVPSRVLLDAPYPDNLPVVPACFACNNGLSDDEQYLACLIECVSAGSVEAVSRQKILGVFHRSPHMITRLERSMVIDAEGLVSFDIEEASVRKVVLKLARGHAAFELGSVPYSEPSVVTILPIYLLSPEVDLTLKMPLVSPYGPR